MTQKKLPAPEPREPLQANPTDPILSRRANPGLILPIHEDHGPNGYAIRRSTRWRDRSVREPLVDFNPPGPEALRQLALPAGLELERAQRYVRCMDGTAAIESSALCPAVVAAGTPCGASRG